MMPTGRPLASTTGSRPTLCLYISRAACSAVSSGVPAGLPQRVERAGVHVIFHGGDHQPDRVTGRQPVPHRRREQVGLFPVDRAVSLRHALIISKNH